ncbi:uncharacterized protein LOC108044063 [Drosophila rhopaloa]|uniref:CCDC113/CCDC96 coiled-coil domain-containing protein n=1 Tax=Drosophila rhopaloa TaxID=1041015 RepID=A0ABM5HCW1_DRORH|nr:uncharacterized protein LOC108044063 [Drosophila rhopaloa]
MSFTFRTSSEVSGGTAASTDSESRNRSSSVSIYYQPMIRKKNEENSGPKAVSKKSPKKEVTSSKKATKVAKTSGKSPRKMWQARDTFNTIPKWEKSRASSREPSRRWSQKFSFRDRLSRSSLFDSPSDQTSLMTMASQASILSRVSTISRRSRSPRKRSNQPSLNKPGFWGRHRIHLLKAVKPKVEEVVDKVLDKSPDTSETERIQIKYIKSSDTTSIRINTISDSDSKRVLTSLISDYESDRESSASELDIRVEKQEDREQVKRINFLNLFGRLPDINMISPTSSKDIVDIPEEEKIVVAAVDKRTYRPSKSETSMDFEKENENTENLYTQTVTSEISSEAAVEIDDEIESEEAPDEAEVEDIREFLLSIRPRATIFDQIISGRDSELHLANKNMVKQFLAGLMNDVVQYAENTSVRMGRLLDKEKMLEELHQLSDDYQYEMHRNQALEKITTEYYVWRKEIASVSKPKHIDVINSERFMSALVELDDRLYQKQNIKKTSSKQICDLKEQLSVARNQDAQKIRHLEEKIRESLCKEGWDHLNIVVDEILQNMSNVRDDISHLREELFSVQHRLQAIKNKSQKMENLGNGLHVNEYISNQAHNQSLGIKVGEKDLELRRLRDRTTYAIHAMTHWTNKKMMNEELLENMKSKLQTQEERKKDLRDRLHVEMVRHKELKRQDKKLRTAGCLMHYPDMLRDYDATVKFLKTKRKVVRQLRLEHKRLEQRNLEMDNNIRLTSVLRTKLSFVSGSFGPNSKKFV